MRSNADDGYIDTNELNSNMLKLDIHGFNNTDELLNVCFGGLNVFKQFYSGLFVKNGIFVESVNSLSFSNLAPSSKAVGYETVDEIRENAPVSFRMGNRLITKSDFRTYILNKYKSSICDVYISNNFEYCTIFYNWLKKYNKFNIDIRKYNYMFSDACDFNNIYLWLLPNNTDTLSLGNKHKIISDCNRIKSITAELVPCDVIKTFFVPFIKHPQITIDIENQFINNTNWISPCKIILVKKKDCLINDSQLVSQVNKIFIDYFNKKQLLGAQIDLDTLTKDIYKIPGISSIKTRYIIPKNNDLNYIEYEIEGLSFAYFSIQIINRFRF